MRVYARTLPAFRLIGRHQPAVGKAADAAVLQQARWPGNLPEFTAVNTLAAHTRPWPEAIGGTQLLSVRQASPRKTLELE